MMASWVLSECCGVRPLPANISRPKSSLHTTRRSLPCATARGVDIRRQICLGGRALQRDWALRVSAPLRVAAVEEEREGGEINGKQVNGYEGEEPEFDPGMPPPFGLAEIRAAIPKHCWVKDPWKSLSYVVRDVVAVFGLAAAAAYLNNWMVWPLYWVAQGTMFWALFVLGHDWYGFLPYHPVIKGSFTQQCFGMAARISASPNGCGIPGSNSGSSPSHPFTRFPLISPLSLSSSTAATLSVQSRWSARPPRQIWRRKSTPRAVAQGRLRRVLWRLDFGREIFAGSGLTPQHSDRTLLGIINAR